MTLYVVFPRFTGQFAQGVQFSELRFVVGIGNAAGAQAVAEAERHGRKAFMISQISSKCV